MDYSHFLTILMSYKKYNQIISSATDVGFDLLEGKYSTTSYVDDILKSSIQSHYGEGGWEWVEWFIFETNYGYKDYLEAFDEDKNRICYSYESLYSYLQTNHNIKQAQ